MAVKVGNQKKSAATAPRSSDDSYNDDGESFNERLDRDYGKGDSLPSWIGRTAAQANNELLNFRTDGAVNSQNFWGWLTGGPQDATAESVRESWLRPGGSMDLYRRPPASASGDPSSPLTRMLGKGSKMLGKGEAPQQAEQELTFADYLAMANEMVGGTPDYAAMEQYLRDNASSADTRLEAMYRQLRGSIDADAPGIGQNYDSAGAAMDQNAQQAQATTNQGYDAARAAQTQQLEALGIGEAAGTLAANGGFAAGDQGAANANIEQNRLAGMQQTTANKASALNYNTGIGNAAGLEGNVQRALVQQQLAQKLAELSMQEQQDSVSSRSNSISLAQVLQKQALEAKAASGPLSIREELELQKLAGEVTAQDYKNQALAANSSVPVGANLSQYQTLFQQAGGDPANIDDLLKFIEAVKATQ